VGWRLAVFIEEVATLMATSSTSGRTIHRQGFISELRQATQADCSINFEQRAGCIVSYRLLQDSVLNKASAAFSKR
jgi:hypothetical protein